MRVFASLIAGAVGDSLGAGIEFMSLTEIQGRFPNGVDHLAELDGVAGAITDDTQMTLFTAEGLLRAWVRGSEKGIVSPPSIVHHALLRWLVTQGTAPRVEVDSTGLVRDRRLHARRAPGQTNLNALAEAEAFGQRAVNDSKGCGTIMRVAPVAFMPNREAVRQLAIETSALTHGHPTGQLAAAAWAEMLTDVLEGRPLLEAAKDTEREYRAMPDGQEVADAIRTALDAPADGSPTAIERLGAGWVAEEALSIALCSCLNARDLESGLRMAVTHSGDSDSTGAIAGNMLGLIYPDQVLEHRWSDQVECHDLIETLAIDLSALGRQEAVLSTDLALRYPPT